VGFENIQIKTEYRSSFDNIVKDFYIPLLAQSIEYRRAVGFFSSSALAEIATGITGLVKNGGKIKLIASPYLSEEDIDAIKTGYGNRDDIIQKSLTNTLKEPKNYYEQERLNLLSNLIAENKLDIKIALLEKNKILGMYHEKMGILYDQDGNKIAFSGSMNESSMALNMNYESIDVFCSWTNQYDNNRAIAKEEAFQRIWNNEEPNVLALEFPKVEQAILDRYKRPKIDFTVDSKEVEALERIKELSSGKDQSSIGVSVPPGIKLYEFQNEAIEEWMKCDYQGIFDMATGTGKTLTALAGVAKLYEHVEGRLAVIIVCPYQHLVEQWVEDIRAFNIRPIIGYSSSIQKDWKKRLDNAIHDQKVGVKTRQFFLLCVYKCYFFVKLRSRVNV